MLNVSQFLAANLVQTILSELIVSVLWTIWSSIEGGSFKLCRIDL